MKGKIKGVLGAIGLAVLSSSDPLFALDRLQPKPLTEVVSAAVQPCGSPKPVRVPLITWGGDIPTVYANGGRARTTPDSIFGAAGLDLELARQDVFSEQLKAYLRCESPFLRGTAGMIAHAAEAASRDPRTAPKVIYQLTWSAGGDALVVKEGIKSPADLRGKAIAIQAYGPHLDYLSKVLTDAGLSVRDVKLFWVKDLTGTDQTPAAALALPEVSAAMVIIPDAMALTSGGAVGTGAESSVKGARILLTTKSANRIIADLYAVRSDYYDAHKSELERFVRGLLLAQEKVKELFKDRQTKSAEFNRMISGAAQLLLDSPEAAEDTAAMFADAEFAGLHGNTEFFTSAKYPRNFEVLMAEIQTALRGAGMIGAPQRMTAAMWDYQGLKKGLSETAPESRRFDEDAVARVVTRKQQQGTLDQSGLFTFEVFFKPNQSDFSPDLYEQAFNKAIELAATYGGAIMTVEGHSDPLEYLREKKRGENELVLKRTRQAAKNLSLTRANAVRNSIIAYAQAKGVQLDPSQFATVGHGLDKPKSGMCGGEPCAPKTEKEWLDNMRVEFRLVQVEAEASVFKPL